MVANYLRSISVAAALAVTGCATVLPNDPIIEDARISLNSARNSPQVVTYAPVELAQATDAMRQTDDLVARGGSAADIHQLAALANQRATLALQVARTRSEQAALVAQKRANDAQMSAELTRRQAESAQLNAAAAQRQADEAARIAASTRTDVYSPALAEYRRRDNERVYEAKVTYVRAVVGPPQQRCWVEPAVVDHSAGVNVPGAIVGGAIGGIIGHQIGGGRGQDIATGVGIVSGAAIGANVGRSDGLVYSQDVQHCEYAPTSGRPDYWDVTYVFDGREHRAQMTTAPGPTILVNAQGEPRF